MIDGYLMGLVKEQVELLKNKLKLMIRFQQISTLLIHTHDHIKLNIYG